MTNATIETTTEATTNDARIIFTPEVMAMLEKAAKYEQEYYAKHTSTTTTTAEVSEMDLTDLADHADDIVAGTVSFIQEELMPPAAQMLFNAAADLLEGDKGPQDRLAYVLYLDALIASPEAVQASLQALRDGLVKNDPALALVK